ncbi:MAG: glycosyl transferase [Candidatus Rokuibacteriota bacterium]|nr:MAG: glycosyl transferase [Candidatus Rokubacteria bacterium]
MCGCGLCARRPNAGASGEDGSGPRHDLRWCSRLLCPARSASVPLARGGIVRRTRARPDPGGVRRRLSARILVTAMTQTLSIVMPVHDEAEHLSATVEALVAAVGRSDFEVDVVLVDDGSVDGSAEVVRDSLCRRLPFRVVRQPNRGRFEARRAGLEAASAEWVLLLDARVRIDQDALAFVGRRIKEGGQDIWNGQIHVVVDGNPYGAFWNVLAELAWSEYFDDPRTTSFDSKSFDHYPKGTGCFLAPRRLLLDAVASFRTHYTSPRFVSDDTGLIRSLAERNRIHVSPEFAARYAPRTSLGAFLTQALYRGSTFLDGHGRSESRFYPAAIAFFPASLACLVGAVRRPAVAPMLAIGTGLAAGAVAARAQRSRFEISSVALLTPPYALFHGLGMWRGLGLILWEKWRRKGIDERPARRPR